MPTLVTVEQGGAALKLRATLHSCYLIRCVRGAHFRPGRAAFKANGLGQVLRQTYLGYADG